MEKRCPACSRQALWENASLAQPQPCREGLGRTQLLSPSTCCALCWPSPAESQEGESPAKATPGTVQSRERKVTSAHRLQSEPRHPLRTEDLVISVRTSSHAEPWGGPSCPRLGSELLAIPRRPWGARDRRPAQSC